MRTAIHSRIPAVASVILVAGTLVFANTAAAEIQWQENLRTAHAQAKSEGKLLLLHFYSDDCVWCERLEAGSFQDPKVAAALQQGFVPVKIHGGKNPKMTQMFNIKAFPTDVIVTTEGKALSHSVSPQKPADYVAMLQGVPGTSSSPAISQPQSGQAIVATTPTQTAPNGPAVGVPDYARNGPVQSAAPTTNIASGAADAASANPPGTVASLTMPVSEPSAQPPQSPPANPGLEIPGTTTGILAGARTDEMRLANETNLAAGMGLELPDSLDKTADANVKVTESATVTDSDAIPVDPELAMQGYCAVTVIKEDRWVEGNPKFGVVHLGKLYLFANAESMQTFLADPIPYTPVLNEIDVVRFFEERKIVPGKREWGLKDPTHNRMFFFADEAAMNHFWNEYKRYTGPAIEVMNQAIADANPGT